MMFLLKHNNEDYYSSLWDLVQVTTIGMGGTNTLMGNVLLEYNLLPVSARYADVIVSAYSSNDMHHTTFRLPPTAVLHWEAKSLRQWKVLLAWYFKGEQIMIAKRV
jgi:hypothetical protein